MNIFDLFGLLFADFAFNTAVNSVSTISAKGMYQPKEPENLQSYTAK